MGKIFLRLSRLHWYISVPLLIVAGIAVYVLIYSVLEWSNSTHFCGTTCHVMTPEYTAYQDSPHARVPCTGCHVGPGLWAEIRAKAQAVRELYLNVTHTYELPIPSPVENLRPARETCEECHWPQIFLADRAIEIPHFADDGSNSRLNTYMLVKVGGGANRRTQNLGIHWHIENPVEYIAVDPQRQRIPWIRAQLGGRTITFVDAAEPLSDQDLPKYQVRVMDCIDCHNRATHIFRSAEDAVDQAMADGLLPSDLTSLHEYAVETMEATYPNNEEAQKAIAAIADMYRQDFPQVYEQRQQDIQQAIQTLQGLYKSSHFPDWSVYPTTYSDNIGHSEFPGCFRCHDGKHFSQQGDAIRLHCNICHSIPQTVAQGESPPNVPFAEALAQPSSHLASNWIAVHHNVADQSCSSCHDVSAFCANPNCHGRTWPYVDIRVFPPPNPPATPGAAETPGVPTAAPAQTTAPLSPEEQIQQGATLFSQLCLPCHSNPESVTAEQGELDYEEFSRTILNGTDGMPAFQLTPSQLDDLAAFVIWWRANPQQPLPVVTAAPSAPASAATPLPSGTSSSGVPSFSADILPILQAKCGSSCHSATVATAGFRADDYVGVSAEVTPGNPDGSRLVQIQRGDHPAKLTADELNQIVKWIQAGAPNN